MKHHWLYAPTEYTEIGYTLKSLDRLWAVVSVDDFTDSEGDLFGNWLWLTDDTIAGRPVSSYDLVDYVPVWDRVAEACTHLANLADNERWHVLNIGDDTRFERAYLDGVPWTPKASSKPALQHKLDTLRQIPTRFGNERFIRILEAVL